MQILVIVVVVVIQGGGLGWGRQAYARGDVCAYAQRLDRYADRELRALITPGAFRVPGCGLQIHPECFRLMEEKTPRGKKPPTRKQMEKQWTQFARESLEAVTHACMTRYPEIRPFLREWVTQFRRAVITCSHLDSKDSGFGGLAYYRGCSFLPKDDPEYCRGRVQSSQFDPKKPVSKSNPKWKSEDPKKPVLRDSAKTGIAADWKSKKEWQRRISPNISLARDVAALVLMPEEQPTGTLSDARETLLHEIFHFTSADHHAQHNEHARSQPGDPKDCKNANASDRVYVLPYLCMGENHPFRDTGAGIREVLAGRIEACGFKQGCEDVFAADASESLSPWGKPVDIPRGDARLLCLKIYEEQYCRAEKNRTDVGSELTRQSPALQKYKKEFEKILDRMMPDRQGHVPIALLERFPEDYKKIMDPAFQECREAYFDRRANGDLDLKAAKSRPPRDEFLSRRISRVRDDEWLNMDAVPSEVWLEHPGCSLEMRREFWAAGTALRTRVVDAVKSSFFQLSVWERFLGHAEKVPDFKMEPARADPNDVVASVLARANHNAARIMGMKLTNQYLDDLRRYHYMGQNFDCEAHGLTPKTTVERLLRSLKTLPKMEQPASCRLR